MRLGRICPTLTKIGCFFGYCRSLWSRGARRGREQRRGRVLCGIGRGKKFKRERDERRKREERLERQKEDGRRGENLGTSRGEILEGKRKTGGMERKS